MVMVRVDPHLVLWEAYHRQVFLSFACGLQGRFVVVTFLRESVPTSKGWVAIYPSRPI